LKAQFELVSIHLGVADVFEAKDCLKDHFIIKTSLSHAGAKVDDHLIPLAQSEHPLSDVGDELVVINFLFFMGRASIERGIISIVVTILIIAVIQTDVISAAQHAQYLTLLHQAALIPMFKDTEWRRSQNVN
jgi:hypothetical protein